jgi:hypothetical protein
VDFLEYESDSLCNAMISDNQHMKSGAQYVLEARQKCARRYLIDEGIEDSHSPIGDTGVMVDLLRDLRSVRWNHTT